MTTFEIKARFDVSAEAMFEAWLNSAEHSNMTGGAAVCSARSGDDFSAWDGYISGQNLELAPHSYIKQSWRTTEFQESDEPSILDIRIDMAGEGCEITLIHSNIPAKQPDYQQGWEDHYFSPMMEYFK